MNRSVVTRAATIMHRDHGMPVREAVAAGVMVDLATRADGAVELAQAQTTSWRIQRGKRKGQTIQVRLGPGGKWKEVKAGTAAKPDTKAKGKPDPRAVRAALKQIGLKYAPVRKVDPGKTKDHAEAGLHRVGKGGNAYVDRAGKVWHRTAGGTFGAGVEKAKAPAKVKLRKARFGKAKTSKQPAAKRGMKAVEMAFDPNQARDKAGRWRALVAKVRALEVGETLKVGQAFEVKKVAAKGDRKYRVTMKTGKLTNGRRPDQHVAAQTPADAADAALGVSPAEAESQVRNIRAGRSASERKRRKRAAAK